MPRLPYSPAWSVLRRRRIERDLVSNLRRAIRNRTALDIDDLADAYPFRREHIRELARRHGVLRAIGDPES